ncbi:uncharacterized protein LOC115882495 [Sitophilus oryzae]|uniref:Uncharacterized protein LOC115882495 n=1 Tax=Sitophilus oryzae TaxID=7048 RepID=A0A6J2XY96_SITOR|nr:uncharacterized protein LOC115882495 [Sitophilus oryzae]XP_030756432.1 uncharacterized protein LOC115882495 [Sitophilus oryzae]
MAPPPVSEDRSPIYDAVTCALSCALQSDSDLQRINAECIKKLEVVDEYPVVLCQIVGSNDEALAERHLAAVFLKNYLEDVLINKREWPGLYEKQYGKKLCQMLLNHLSITHSNIKIMVSYILAVMLGLGFWDSLTIELNDMTRSDNTETVNDAVLVLAQAIDKKFFEEVPTFRVEHHWFKVLLDVFKTTSIRSETRISVIRPMYMMMKYVRPNEFYVPECWTMLSAEFEKALVEPFSINSDFQFKGEIVQFITGSVEEFEEYSSIFLPPSLHIIASLLTYCRDVFKRVLRKPDKTPPKDCSEGDTDDPCNFTDLVIALLSYIHSMIDTVYFNMLFEDFENLLYCVFIFMACYDDMEEHLYSEEAETDHHFGMRQIGCQIITTSLQKLEDSRPDGKVMYFESLHHVFQRFTTEFEASSASCVEIQRGCYMTRVTEALIFGLTMVKEKLPSRDPEFVFPLEHYINYWTKIQLLKPINMSLTARIIWMCGVFCLDCSPNILGYQLKSIFQKIITEPKLYFIPLVDTLCNFLKCYPKMSQEQQCAIRDDSRAIICCLLGIARKEDFPLNHLLNAIGYFVKAFHQITTDNIDAIEDILVKVVNSHISVPYILKEVHFIVAKLAQNRNFKILSHDKFLSYLYHVIHNFEPNHMQNHLDKTLDILNTFALYTPSMDEYLIIQLFMGAANLLNKAEEPEFEVEESAAILLTTLIIKQIERLKFIRQDPKNQIAIQAYPELLAKMLQPDVVLPAHVCDKLVVVSIFEFSDLMEPHFEIILRNVITSNCRHQQNIIPTWMIFAFICMIRTSSTVAYLSLIPGPNGGSALNYIMNSWKLEYIKFLDIMERKIMVLAISRIIQCCMENEVNYSKMQEVNVSVNRTNEAASHETLSGIEYLYFLLIDALLFEEREKLKNVLDPQITFVDFGEDIQLKHIQDDRFLYHQHPFNINVVGHLVLFFKTANDLYLNVIRKCVSAADLFKLKDLGCSVPEMALQEDME